MPNRILVTGASGKLAGAVIRHLLETEAVPPANVIVVTRDPSKIAALANNGVETRAGSFDDAGGLARAFAGADVALIVSTDTVDRPGGRLAQHLAAIAAAQQAGVGHIAYTSMFAPEPGNPVLFAPDHHATEEAIRASGAAWTIFRNGWYQENLLMTLTPALASGKWFSSAGEGRTAYVLRDDLARAIAAGLARPAGTNRTLTLSGPQALTNREIAALASQATGRPIELVDLTDEQLAQGMQAAGVPAGLVPLLVSFEAATRAGVLGEVTDAIESLTGTPPAPLHDWLAANRAALAG